MAQQQIENGESGLVVREKINDNFSELYTANTTLAGPTGAGQVGSNDGAGGSLWTTVAGFITYLRSSVGSSIVGFLQSGTGAVGRTAQAKLRETRATTDKSGNFTAQVNAWLDDRPEGGLIRSGTGTLVMTAGVKLDGNGFNLRGEGRDASIIDPQFGGIVFDIDKGAGQTPYHNRVSDFQFFSANTSNKTLFRFRNAANCEVARNFVAEGAILGNGSIGLLVEGRELCHSHDNVWAIAKPIRIVRNADALNITTDYLVLEREHCIAQVATEACIESTGTYLSNLVIRDSALVRGAEGVKLVNTTLAATSYCVSVQNTRREQIGTATAYSYHFDFSGASATLQTLDFDRNYADRMQRGLYGRGVRRALVTNSIFPQDGLGGAQSQAIDYTLPAGGSLTLLQNTGAAGGVKTIANAHPVIRVPSRTANDPIGAFEHWEHFVTPTDPGAGGVINYDDVPSVFLGAVETSCFEMTVPTGSRFIRLPLLPANTVGTDAVGAEVFIRSKTGRLHAFYPADGSNPTTIAATGTFAATATSNRIYADGFPNGVIADGLTAAEVIRVEVRK